MQSKQLVMASGLRTRPGLGRISLKHGWQSPDWNQLEWQPHLLQHSMANWFYLSLPKCWDQRRGLHQATARTQNQWKRELGVQVEEGHLWDKTRWTSTVWQIEPRVQWNWLLHLQSRPVHSNQVARGWKCNHYQHLHRWCFQSTNLQTEPRRKSCSVT